MNRNSLVKSLFALSLVIISCGKGIEYEKYANVTDYQWDMNDVKSFDVPIQDTTNSFDVFIMLRNNGQYPWRNIHLFVTTTSPAGQQVKDTVEYYLADEMGKWLGSGWGNIWTNQLPYRINVRFPYKGIYEFYIQQGMRNEKLPGVLDVGLMIKKHQTRD